MIRHLLRLAALLTAAASLPAQPVSCVRYRLGSTVSYGHLDGDQIVQLRDAPWVNDRPTRARVSRARMTLLAPATPTKVIAVGFTCQTHLGERNPAAYPGLFAKLPSSIIVHNDTVVLTADADNVHYEGEMALVSRKRAHTVPVETVLDYVFGITSGNDVSERD